MKKKFRLELTTKGSYEIELVQVDPNEVDVETSQWTMLTNCYMLEIIS